MNHHKRLLSNLCALAVGTSFVACMNSSQTKAAAPSPVAANQAVAPAAVEPTAQEQVSTGTAAQDAYAGTGATGSGTGATGTMDEAQSNAPQTWGAGASQPNSPPMGVTNPMGGMDVSGLNDAQLAAVVHAMNDGEIQEAQLAETKASAASVKRYAQHLLNAHRDMMNKNSALLARLQIIPSDNSVSNQIKSDAQNELSTLRSMRGKDFDRDYVDAQVRNHNKSLELVDRVAPLVKNAEVRAQLQSDRTRIEAHLRDAERLQESLQKGSTNAQPPAWREQNPPGGRQSGPNTL